MKGDKYRDSITPDDERFLLLQHKQLQRWTLNYKNLISSLQLR